MSYQIKQPKVERLGWLVWGLSATFYFADYLARVAPGVMHQSLQEAFKMSEAGFGTLTASFYIPYILMQIPVGLLVDRLSVRRILTIMSLVTALGCVIFGLAGTLFVGAIGRMLIGVSAAFAFVSTLRLATSWFPPVMLGLLAGLTQALGMLGAAAGEVPVSFLVAKFGWRYSLFLIAFSFVVLSWCLYHFVRDKPRIKKSKALDVAEVGIFRSLKIVLASSQTWFNALYAGFLFVPTAVIGEAIGPAYFQFGRGFEAHAAAFVTGLIFIGWGIGGPVSGFLSDHIGRRKPLMLASAAFGFLWSIVVVFMPTMSVFFASVILFLFGLTNTGVAIAYAVSTEIQPRAVIGTSIAFTNMISIFVGALMQPLVGLILDLVAKERAYHVMHLTLNDFQKSLFLLPVCSLIALFLAFFVKETYCKHQEE